MDHERREDADKSVTRIYREDPEACAEAVLYVLGMRQPEPLEELPGE